LWLGLFIKFPRTRSGCAAVFTCYDDRCNPTVAAAAVHDVHGRNHRQFTCGNMAISYHLSTADASCVGGLVTDGRPHVGAAFITVTSGYTRCTERLTLMVNWHGVCTEEEY